MLTWAGKDVMLVNPPYAIDNVHYLAPQLGIAAAADTFRRLGASVRILDQALEMAEGRLTAGPDLLYRAAHQIANLRPDVVGFSLQCFNAPIAVAIARRLSDLLPSTFLLAGGQHAPHLYTDAGVPLPPFRQIVRDVAELNGSSEDWRNSTLNFEHFPDVARYKAISHQFSGLVEIARGCPFDCTFCTIPSSFGRKHRTRSFDCIGQEIAWWRAAGVDDIHLVDDILTINPRHLEALLSKLSDFAGLSWTGMTRADLVTAPMLKAMARAGCRGLLYGIEAADPATRRLLSKRDDRYPMLTDLAEWNRAAGLRSTYYFMVNSPGETRESIRATIAVACQMSAIDPGSCRFNLPRITPGTALHRRVAHQMTLDLGSPYAEVLLKSVGSECLEVFDLIAEYPTVFSTYYAADCVLPPLVASCLVRELPRLLSIAPLTVAALNADADLFELCDGAESGKAGMQVIRKFVEAVAVYAPDLLELLELEIWLSGPRSNELLSTVDLVAARSAALSSPVGIRSAIGRTRQTYPAAAQRNSPGEEAINYG